MAFMWENVSGRHGRKANVFKERKKETRLICVFISLISSLSLPYYCFDCVYLCLIIELSGVCIYTVCSTSDFISLLSTLVSCS